MKAALGMTAATILWLACGSGGGNNPGGGGGGGGGGAGMTASVDGQAFSASQASATASTSNTVAVYTITGVQGSSAATAQSLVILLYNISGPGTYPLGVNATNFGGIGSVNEGANSWITPLNGTSGTIIITSLGSGRIAGTFSFTAAQISAAGGNRTVTNGAFDLALSGTPGTVQPYQGSMLKATLGTTAWIAGTIVVSKPSGTYSFIGTSQPLATASGASSVDIVLNGVNGPGTYQIGGPSTNLVSATVGGTGYNSSISGSSGSVVVTSLDANRLKGTFSGTIAAGGGGSLSISNGQFD